MYAIRSYYAAIDNRAIPPDHVVITYEDGEAVASNPTTDSERISLQIVDTNGDPINYSRSLRVLVTDDDGNLTDIIDTNNGTGVIDTGAESDEVV